MWISCAEGVPPNRRIVEVMLLDTLSGEIERKPAYLNPWDKWADADTHSVVEDSLLRVIAWYHKGH
jgi:hypothetical protein